MLRKDWLVEFRDGTGFVFQTHDEALIAACDFVFEGIVDHVSEGHEDAVKTMETLQNGNLEEAISLWNEKFSPPILLKTIERKKTIDGLKALQKRAKKALTPKKELVLMSLGSAIVRNRHQARCSLEKRHVMEHSQMADWLTDLKNLVNADPSVIKCLKGHYG